MKNASQTCTGKRKHPFRNDHLYTHRIIFHSSLTQLMDNRKREVC